MTDLSEIRAEIAEEAFAVPKNRVSGAEFNPDARGDGKLEAEVAVSIARDVLAARGFECLSEPVHIGDDRALYGRESAEGIRELVVIRWDFKEDCFDLNDGIEIAGQEPIHDHKYITGPAFGR